MYTFNIFICLNKLKLEKSVHATFESVYATFKRKFVSNKCLIKYPISHTLFNMMITNIL